jgi:GNAT superfamily N-acetyltransferase
LFQNGKEREDDKMISIRHTTKQDVDAVMNIIEEARRTIAALGIDQWQNGTPNRAMIEEDVALAQGRCIVDDDTCIVGTFALIFDGEPTYDRIFDGSWLTKDKDGEGKYAYLAIHRVAISVVNRGSGISTRLLEYAADTARANGFKSLRIDTHRGNVVMRRMLEKHGFVHCGTIHLQNGDPRVAYERLL